MWRYWRCIFAQSVMKALIWIVLISAAGYAAYKASNCPPGDVCASPQTMKAKK